MTGKTYSVGDMVSWGCFSAKILSWVDLEEDGYKWRCVTLGLDDGRHIDCDWLDIPEVSAQMEPVFA